VLGSLEREALPARSVVVVDEAGMVGTHTLATLLDHAHAAQAKVVLVGDPKQLPEIDAGGAFRALARNLDAVRLTSNRRQRDPIERKALADLRAGRIDRAMERMNAHGRITHAPNFQAACRQMIAAWQTARTGGDQVLLLAARRTDVAYLNGLAQAARLEAGELDAEWATYGRVTLHVGDTVMTLRNDHRRGILNGQRGTVTALHDDGITIHTETGTTVELPRRSLERDEVQLGYASTIHKSQGATTDRSLVLATEELGYEAGYTALTRGRHENHLYITEPRDALEEIRHLRRSASKRLAHERTGDRGSDTWSR
jgi:ATP-dependent exoDNAse (exonuclease V) alpha subunit